MALVLKTSKRSTLMLRVMPLFVKTTHSSPLTNRWVGNQRASNKKLRPIAAKIEKFKASGGVEDSEEGD